MRPVFLTALAAMVALSSCKNNSAAPAASIVKKDSTAIASPKKDFSQVVFASKKDLSCGMPLSAGLEDSVHYEGKIYGFCSQECKDAFVKNPPVNIK